MEFSDKKLTPQLVCAIAAAGVMAFAGVTCETALNITFPTLMREFNISTDAVQWLTTGYLLVLAIIVPASGWLKNNFSARRLFLAAEAFFICGTLLCLAADNFALLLAGRLVQGLGTGIAMPLMFNLVLEEVPPQQAGLMMGFACMIPAMAPVAGPFFGGLIITYLGWRMIFAFLLPLLLLSLIAGFFTVPHRTRTAGQSFAFGDYIFLAAGFTLFILATSFSAQSGWLSLHVLTQLLASFVLLGIFYKRSLRSKTPVFNVEILHNRAFTAGACALVLIYFTVLGLGFLIPCYAQLVFGTNPFTAGCLLLPGCIMGIMFTVLGGRLLDCYGARLPIICGNLFMLCAVGAMALLMPGAENFQLAALYTIFACGQAASISTTTLVAIRCLKEADAAGGNAVINTIQPLAGALGTSVCASVVAASQKLLSGAAGTQAGTAHAFILLAALTFGILACSLKMLGGKRSKALRGEAC